MLRNSSKFRNLLPIMVFLGMAVFGLVFLLGRRNIRLLLILVLLGVGILLLLFKKWKSGIIVSACIIPLFLLTAPGIFAPVFWKLEKAKLGIIKSDLQNTVDRRITEALPETELENNFEKLSEPVSFYYTDIFYKKQENYAWVVFISEGDKGCGYAWASDKEAAQDMKDLFDKVISTTDENWFLVKIWPIHVK